MPAAEAGHRAAHAARRASTFSRRLHALGWRVVASVWRACERHVLPRRDRTVRHGLHVRDLLDGPAPDDEVQKLVHALDLLAEVDPRRMARLRRDLDAVALLDVETRTAVFMPGSRTCYVSLWAARAYSAAMLAVVIAHEGTHARLDALRVLPALGGFRHRAEHRCLREELDLAARFPAGRFPELDRWAEHRRATSRHASRARRARRTARPVRVA